MGDKTGCPSPPKIIPVRAHPHGAQMIQGAINRAQALVGIVRDEGAESVGNLLDGLNWEQTAAMCVVLAAMVPDDVPIGRLLAWVPAPGDTP